MTVPLNPVTENRIFTIATKGHKRRRVRIGRIWVDALTFADALQSVRLLIEEKKGGSIFTPNVDHFVLAEENPEFRRAYRGASLVFADGVPVVWASRLLRTPIPEKLSGSDMILPIARLAAAERWSVYLLGGAPGVAVAASAQLSKLEGINLVGCDDSLIQAGDLGTHSGVVARIREARPDLLFVALGAPKQELWITRALDDISPTVAIAVGASLDFVAGRLRRAPRWMSSMGMEWLYRLAQEPRRLWRRYLIRGPRFGLIVLRELTVARSQRISD